MKTLYIIRHAKSSWKHPELSDYNRPLNKRGKRDAPFMGELLALKGLNPDLILSSGAKRALTTAKTIAEKIGYPAEKIIIKDDIYESGVSGLLNLLKGLEDTIQSVCIFGHNPEFTTLNNYLSDTVIDNIPTTGIVALELHAEHWSELDRKSCKQVFFEYPKLYFKKKDK